MLIRLICFEFETRGLEIRLHDAMASSNVLVFERRTSPFSTVFTKTTQLIKPNHLVTPSTEAAPQFL